MHSAHREIGIELNAQSKIRYITAMNTNLIVCPNCKAEIPLTDAMAHQVRDRMEKEFAARQRQLIESIEAREKTVADQAGRLRSRKGS